MQEFRGREVPPAANRGNSDQGQIGGPTTSLSPKIGGKVEIVVTTSIFRLMDKALGEWLINFKRHVKNSTKIDTYFYEQFNCP